MAKSNLLQEAIADAKAVREIALENAKEALKEAFTPKLQSMLSAKIQQEMDEMEEGASGYDAEKSNDIADLNALPDVGGEQTPDFKEEKEVDEAKDAVAETKDAVDETADLEEAADLKSSDIGNSDNKEPTKAAHGDESSTEDSEGIHPGTSPAKEDEFTTLDDSKYGLEENQEQELDEELDLESIIKELEEDYMDDDYMDDEYSDEEEMAPEEPVAPEAPVAAPAPEAPVAPVAAPEAPVGGLDGEEELDIEIEDDDDDLYGEAKIAERRDSAYEDGHEEKLKDIDEALASIKNSDTIKELKARVIELAGQLEEKTSIVKEYYDGVKYLKEKLNEVNILNAKLLFTNKLFRNFQLDQKAKLRVIENFDRAVNIREIKLVFTTLAENLKSMQAISQLKKQQVKRITEGASKAISSTKPAADLLKDDNIDVVPDFVARAQKLAGITK